MMNAVKIIYLIKFKITVAIAMKILNKYKYLQKRKIIKLERSASAIDTIRALTVNFS